MYVSGRVTDNTQVIYVHWMPTWVSGVDKHYKVDSYFKSSPVAWARQNANDFMPRNTYNYGDTAKISFAVFDVPFGPNTEY